MFVQKKHRKKKRYAGLSYAARSKKPLKRKTKKKIMQKKKENEINKKEECNIKFGRLFTFEMTMKQRWVWLPSQRHRVFKNAKS